MRRAIGLVLVTSLAVAVLPATAVASSGTKAHLPRVLDCAGKAAFEPGSYVLACADDNTYFDKVHWTHWGTASAKARATFVQNTCTPTCVAGHFVTYPAELTLSKPERTKHGLLFSVIHYEYEVSASSTLPLEPLPAVPATPKSR